MRHTTSVARTALMLEDHSFTAAAGGSVTLEPAVRQLCHTVRRWQEGDLPAFLTLINQAEQVKSSQSWAERIRARAERLLLFGIGGSSLGGEMLVRTAGHNTFPVLFHDNVDPVSLTHLDQIDWRHSFALFVSKSGNTAETLSQLLMILPDLEAQLGDQLPHHVAVITENPHQALGQIATELGWPQILHPAVGGRFSVLSVVGMLPAALAGVDLVALQSGAQQMMQRCLSDDCTTNPALLASAAQWHMATAGRDITIQMHYGDRLDRLTAWFGQLWGESLGKRNTRGQRCGLTPIAARGVTDQHSQLQLYLDGPPDKQFTLLHDPQSAQQGRTLPCRFQSMEALAPLVNRPIGALFEAEFLGSRDTLIASGAPVRTFHLAAGDAFALGELIVLLETETALTAELFGINAFDQPAVEDGKRRARVYLQQITENRS
ncbi:MAG: hypothetical protein HQL58_07735 [Magnetococcales bacterium]|nr:hypothetical protein [Magnetococcales bacterium]